MQRKCDVCGTDYEAKRSTSKFCGGTCRTRAVRGRAATPAATATAPTVTLELQPLSATLLAELEQAKRADSVLGQLALSHAQRLETNLDTGSARASLSKEMRAARAEALVGALRPESQLEDVKDEVAARRAARRRA